MPNSNALIWRLVFPDQMESYLYGTIHLNSMYFERHKLGIRQLMSQCSGFSAEIDLQAMQQTDPVYFFRMKGNQKWEHLLKPNQLSKMRSVAKKHFKIHLDSFFELYPMMLVHLISMEMSGSAGSKILDQQLWDIANELGMHSTGLEDLDVHFSMLAKIPLTDQIRMLKSLLYKREASARALKVLKKKYESGDIRFVYAKSKRMLGANKRLMLYERNLQMASRMLLLGKDENHFFCCGAAHLSGAYGILRILKKQGIRIEPVHL